MHFAIHLKTAKFDVLSEDENPINPIYGQSLLKWLKRNLNERIKFSEIEAEDWGWYCHVEFNNMKYMLGSSTFFEEGDNPKSELDWVFQVEKIRTIKEKLLLKNKMTINDECLLFFKSYLKSEKDIKVLSIE